MLRAHLEFQTENTLLSYGKAYAKTNVNLIMLFQNSLGL